MDEDVVIVLRYEGEGFQPFVALDRNGGGYPVPVYSVWRAHHWRSEEEALRYAAMFAGPGKIAQKVSRFEAREK